MSKKPTITPTDQALFRDAMRNVKPYSDSKKVSPEPIQPKRRPRQRFHDEEPETSPLSDYETLDSLSSEDIVEYARPGLQNKILRDLRGGKYNVDAILDLHGMTVIEAREALYQFLVQCPLNNARHVLIIHGKGRGTSKPILKNKLNHWLRQIELVLAFCSATGRDGRSGAMYVLLKNQSKETRI